MPIIHGHTIQRIHAIHDIIQHTYKDTVQHHTYTIQYHTRYNSKEEKVVFSGGTSLILDL